MKIRPRIRSISARARLLLLIATGLALPLYAFPIATATGKQVDLATFFGALFVISSLPGLRRERSSRSSWLWLAASAAVPLLILIPPRLERFASGQFASSYGHWLLLVTFFFAAGRLQLSEVERRRLVVANVIAGTVVALFAFYQVFGIPRGWPGAGTMLVPFQREPLRLRNMGIGYVRPSSLFLEPAWMGGYVAWVIALAAGLILESEGNRRARVLGSLSLVVMLSAVLASVSWGAYADLAAALATGGLVFLLVGSSGRRGFIALGAVLVVVVLLAGFSDPGRRITDAARTRLGWLIRTPVLTQKMTKDVMDSSWVRYQNLAHTTGLFRSRYKRGIGLGQFPYFSRKADGGAGFRDPWCGWVAIAAEMGFLGPVLLLVPILLALRRWWRNRSRLTFRTVTPALLAVAIVFQLHTASFADLWFWYPLSLALVLSAPAAGPRSHG